MRRDRGERIVRHEPLPPAALVTTLVTTDVAAADDDASSEIAGLGEPPAEPVQHPEAGVVLGPEGRPVVGQHLLEEIEHLVRLVEPASHRVVAPERDQRAEHLIAAGIVHRELEATLVVRRRLRARVALAGDGQEAAPKPELHLLDVADRAFRKHRDEVDRAPEMLAGLVESATASGLVGRPLVARDRFGVTLGELVVVRERDPVDDVVLVDPERQRVGDPPVDDAAGRGSQKVVCDLTKQLVAEPVALAVPADGLEDEALHQRGDRVVEIGRSSDRRSRRAGLGRPRGRSPAAASATCTAPSVA